MYVLNRKRQNYPMASCFGAKLSRWSHNLTWTLLTIFYASSLVHLKNTLWKRLPRTQGSQVAGCVGLKFLRNMQAGGINVGITSTETVAEAVGVGRPTVERVLSRLKELQHLKARVS